MCLHPRLCPHPACAPHRRVHAAHSPIPASMHPLGTPHLCANTHARTSAPTDTCLCCRACAHAVWPQDALAWVDSPPRPRQPAGTGFGSPQASPRAACGSDPVAAPTASCCAASSPCVPSQLTYGHASTPASIPAPQACAHKAAAAPAGPEAAADAAAPSNQGAPLPCLAPGDAAASATVGGGMGAQQGATQAHPDVPTPPAQGGRADTDLFWVILLGLR